MLYRGVIVGDNQIAKEMLSIDAFVGRANVDEFTLFEGEHIGMFLTCNYKQLV